jgi:hypothetical protein
MNGFVPSKFHAKVMRGKDELDLTFCLHGMNGILNLDPQNCIECSKIGEGRERVRGCGEKVLKLP